MTRTVNVHDGPLHLWVCQPAEHGAHGFQGGLVVALQLPGLRIKAGDHTAHIQVHVVKPAQEAADCQKLEQEYTHRSSLCMCR